MGPSSFFDKPTYEARKVCAVCPVKATCLAYALAGKIDHGTWGGTSERERRKMLRADYPYIILIRRLRGARHDLVDDVRNLIAQRRRDEEKRRVRREQLHCKSAAASPGV